MANFCTYTLPLLCALVMVISNCISSGIPNMAVKTASSLQCVPLAIITYTAISFIVSISPYSVSGIEVKIAAILPEDSSRLFSSKRVAPAIEYAIDYLQNKTDLLNGHTMKVSYRDSKCSSAHGMNHAINYYVEKEVDVFFGPVCDFSVAPVARQAMFWNLPLISVGAMARDFKEYRKSEYLLLVRVGPVNFDSLSMYIKHLLYYNNWNSYKIVYEKDGQSEYMEGFCYLAASSVHYDIMTSDTNITQDYFKLDGDIESMLKNEIGLKFGGRKPILLFFFFKTRLKNLISIVNS